MEGILTVFTVLFLTLIMVSFLWPTVFNMTWQKVFWIILGGGIAIAIAGIYQFFRHEK
ncbi:hypothetical protein FC96_GL002438 [Secundilactobacillus kimchicus JCM 15530]|uniref:Uncharacterized protein n=1 Tax=Secundilactobacillus kimchicus JCM 15530 TaxID=1302272 RepID=A0A0R1HMB1_9LACO|nr:hypothetical protein FC96_GL002438 [Secundilactobacillus kimchicus JCM 15530]